MNDFYIYDNVTGEILRTGSSPVSMIYLQATEPNESFEIGLADEETQYHDLVDNELKAKTESPVTIDLAVTTVVTETDHANEIWLQFPVGTILAVADGLNNIAFENIPNPSKLYLNGEFLTDITDGELEFALDLPSSAHGIERFKSQVENNPKLHSLQIKSVAHLPFEVKIYAV
jgi:hypothetical protein